MYVKLQATLKRNGLNGKRKGRGLGFCSNTIC